MSSSLLSSLGPPHPQKLSRDRLYRLDGDKYIQADIQHLGRGNAGFWSVHIQSSKLVDQLCGPKLPSFTKSPPFAILQQALCTTVAKVFRTREGSRTLQLKSRRFFCGNKVGGFLGGHTGVSCGEVYQKRPTLKSFKSHPDNDSE